MISSGDKAVGILMLLKLSIITIAVFRFNRGKSNEDVFCPPSKAL